MGYRLIFFFSKNGPEVQATLTTCILFNDKHEVGMCKLFCMLWVRVNKNVLLHQSVLSHRLPKSYSVFCFVLAYLRDKRQIYSEQEEPE